MKSFVITLLAAVFAVAAPIAGAQTSIDLPLGVGIRTPGYDRVNGISIPFGPTINVANEKLVVDPLVTYRSNIGKFDPGLTIAWHVDSMVTISTSASRGTFTNEQWIRPDLLNSLRMLLSGSDTRNYFRADRADARVTLHFGEEDHELSVFGGSQLENAWSTGWRNNEGIRRGPWSFTHRGDSLNGGLRANPLIDRGHIASAIFGGHGKYKGSRFAIEGSSLLESAWHTLQLAPSSGKFTQLTINERGLLETFLGQRLELNTHFVITSSDSTPRQRYAYEGGGRTIPTEDLLSMGGDRLFLVDVSYVIPLKGVNLPVVGQPSIQPRFITGAAGVKKFGTPVRNIGGRVMLWLLQVDYLVNPKTHDHTFDVGIQLPL